MVHKESINASYLSH